MSKETKKITPDEDKFAELLLYICMKSEDDDTFGATKLNKVLFYSDFLSYLSNGAPITGCDYQKLEHGPAPRCLMRVRTQLAESGAVATQERQHFGRKQKRTIALRDADLSMFSGAEIAMVDSVISELWGKTAIQVSELSHRFAGWRIVDEGETIPYGAVFLKRRPLSDRERAYGAELAADVGL